MRTPYAAQMNGGATDRYGQEQQWHPPAGHGFDDQQAQFGPPPAPRRRPDRGGRNSWIAFLSGIMIATVAVVSAFFMLGRTVATPANALVGDCLARSGSDVEVVACADPRAAFTVLGRFDGRTRAEAGAAACTPFRATTDVYWKGKGGANERGLVLCLGPAK